MGAWRFALALVTVVAFTMIACSDDEAPTEGGGSDPSNVCDEQFCANNAALRQECEEFLRACLEAEPENEDECVGGALLICG